MPGRDAATTLVLIRHGVTEHTTGKRFSGGLTGADPALSDEGRAQVRATAEWLRPLADDVAAILASPVRRARESADEVAAVFGAGIDLVEEPGFAEMDFGAWDGLTFAEVRDRHRAEMDAWFGNLDHRAGGGESLREVETRVLDALDTTLTRYAGRTVVVVSHVTPIKTIVTRALATSLAAVYRLELAPASATVVTFYGDTAPGDTGNGDTVPMASLRLFNALPGEASLTGLRR